MMTEAITRWPQANSPVLWPYAIRHAQHNINHTPSMTLFKKPTPYEAFTTSKTNRHAREAVPFGCPVYSTRDELLDGKPLHKWDIRSTLGLYLGVIPLHSRRTGLILNLETGLVSPKFHYKADKAFDTVEAKAYQHIWKSRAGLYAKPTNKHAGNAKPAQLTRGAPTTTSSAQCPTGKIPAGGRPRPNHQKYSSPAKKLRRSTATVADQTKALVR